MTNERELAELSEFVRLAGGTVERLDGTIRIVGVPGIGPHPIALISAAERMREFIGTKAGAAILGFRGAIRCCRRTGLDEDRIYQLVRDDPSTNHPH